MYFECLLIFLDFNILIFIIIYGLFFMSKFDFFLHAYILNLRAYNPI